MNIEIPVIIKSSHGSKPGVVKVQRLNQEQRTKRAFKALGISFGLSIASIIVPILHFILVPGFFIAGPIFAYFLYKQKDMVMGGSGTCPGCSKPFSIARGAEVWPLEDVCGLCHEHVTIERS